MKDKPLCTGFKSDMASVHAIACGNINCLSTSPCNVNWNINLQYQFITVALSEHDPKPNLQVFIICNDVQVERSGGLPFGLQPTRLQSTWSNNHFV